MSMLRRPDSTDREGRPNRRTHDWQRQFQHPCHLVGRQDSLGVGLEIGQNQGADVGVHMHQQVAFAQQRPHPDHCRPPERIALTSVQRQGTGSRAQLDEEQSDDRSRVALQRRRQIAVEQVLGCTLVGLGKHFGATHGGQFDEEIGGTECRRRHRRQNFDFQRRQRWPAMQQIAPGLGNQGVGGPQAAGGLGTRQTQGAPGYRQLFHPHGREISLGQGREQLQEQPVGARLPDQVGVGVGEHRVQSRDAPFLGLGTVGGMKIGQKSRASAAVDAIAAQHRGDQVGLGVILFGNWRGFAHR